MTSGIVRATAGNWSCVLGSTGHPMGPYVYVKDTKSLTSDSIEALGRKLNVYVASIFVELEFVIFVYIESHGCLARGDQN